MDEPFDLPVTYKGEEILFPTHLLHLGYVYKFEVDVYGTIVSFEWDDEHNLRALIEPSTMDENKKIDRELLQAIATSIKAIT